MKESFLSDFISFSKKLYGNDFIPLHRPVFAGNEKKYLCECIDSNFVSSVGSKVIEFEAKIAEFTNSKYAVATVNGTSALHIALNLAGVKEGDEVITQSLTFIATCNAIKYSGANPVFIDVDIDTMGMSPNALELFLEKNTKRINNQVVNKKTGKVIKACLPMHTFGFPCRIAEISKICKDWNINLVEDIAESLGSYVSNIHTGKFGEMATLSFNGNKVITTGGGGMLVTDNHDLARKAKHLTTTAKIPHPYEFIHDQIGFNYRMPNLNAALGCAQMERLDEFLLEKSKVANKWAIFFEEHNIEFVRSQGNNQENNWLNAIILNSKIDRDTFLKFTNENGVMTRPIWTLMTKLAMYKDCQTDDLTNSLWLEERIVNIPSSVPDGVLKPHIN